MAKRKSRRNTIKKTKARSRRSTAAVRHGSRIALPIVAAVILLAGIGFFGWMGYQTATASSFFSVREVRVVGVQRSSGDDIKRIVATNAEKTGVWRMDLEEVRSKLEKLPFVKTASISMMLPDGVLVDVVERVPAAIVRMKGGDFLVDSESYVLAPATRREDEMPFALKGWDETKTEKAATENIARLRLYKKMLEEWKEHGVAKRVKEVNLADLREPIAMTEDSGKTIAIILSKDNLAKGLKAALEAAAGKGERINSVNAAGLYPVIDYVQN